MFNPQLVIRGIFMSSIKRFHVAKRLSDMAVYNGVAYLAGQVPEDVYKRQFQQRAGRLVERGQALGALPEMERQSGLALQALSLIHI